MALPGERWCDVVHRRDRYTRQVELLSDTSRDWGIDDAVTENLDLPELLRDYMTQLASAQECEQAFEVLRSLTVCDPTVGSGAFLFAALDVLQPLYEEVLARARELTDDGEPPAEFLVEADARAGSYWLIKTICLRNLFGVDLMHEAPEIAKLRLFLKLAAQIDSVEHLEPLPDLDFNIKCGNLLVGIADERDARERLGGGRLDFGGTIAEIETVAAGVAADYDGFVAAQQEVAGLDLAAAKENLAAGFDTARERCHELLHGIRGTVPYEQWIEAHRPFHWFVEFPSVWRNGGFDVVLGNPPYIKASLVTDYTWTGYETQKCPDLYAVCMERASTLLNDNGRLAMIVMHSLCFSRDFLKLRSCMEEAFGRTWISSYSRASDSLFSGAAKVRNSIFIAKLGRPLSIMATQCHRWLVAARPRLMNSLEYAPIPTGLSLGSQVPSWPFIGDSTIVRAFKRRLEEGTRLSHALSTHGHSLLGYKTTATNWLAVYVDEPPILNPITGELATTSSQRSGWLRFDSDQQRDLALVALAGRWGYLWWLTYGDEFDVTRSTLSAFPGDIERLSKRPPGDMELVSLLDLSREVIDRMPNSIDYHLRGSGSRRVNVGRYNMLKLRHLTDRADWILAKMWGIEDAFEAAGNLRDRMVFGNKE